MRDSGFGPSDWRTKSADNIERDPRSRIKRSSHDRKRVRNVPYFTNLVECLLHDEVAGTSQTHKTGGDSLGSREGRNSIEFEASRACGKAREDNRVLSRIFANSQESSWRSVLEDCQRMGYALSTARRTGGLNVER